MWIIPRKRGSGYPLKTLSFTERAWARPNQLFTTYFVLYSFRVKVFADSTSNAVVYTVRVVYKQPSFVVMARSGPPSLVTCTLSLSLSHALTHALASSPSSLSRISRSPRSGAPLSHPIEVSRRPTITRHIHSLSLSLSLSPSLSISLSLSLSPSLSLSHTVTHSHTQSHML
jgi:hypothetical protein